LNSSAAWALWALRLCGGDKRLVCRANCAAHEGWTIGDAMQPKALPIGFAMRFSVSDKSGLGLNHIISTSRIATVQRSPGGNAACATGS